MVDDWVIKTMYATKRRRKNNKSEQEQDSSALVSRGQTNAKRYQSQLATGYIQPNHAKESNYICDIGPSFCDSLINQSLLTSESHLQLFNQTHSQTALTASLVKTNSNQHFHSRPQHQQSASGQTPIVKSNPSKRHRERLNAELERLASLLPFDEAVIVKLDKLSILRLAVSYLRMKCYFQTISQERTLAENRLVSHLYHFSMDLHPLEGDSCLQALNGFIFIVSCDGEVFSVSQTVESYLGFHQSDILHQSVLELIHSEDREEFKRQLSWKQMLPYEHRNCTLQELMTPKYCHLLQRCFTVRFRCLLDNTSGFITLEISGRLQLLYGQSKGYLEEAEKGSGGSRANPAVSANSPLGLFAVCSPLGPLPSLDGAHRDLTFKTKHNLEFGILNMDNRARALFLFSEPEVNPGNGKVTSIYHYLHPDDTTYVSCGHKELIKTGSIGLLVHRWLNRSGCWIWLQSRIKLTYKNNKPHYILAIHRQLSEEEGRELYIRRNKEYKLPFPLLEPETLLGDEDLCMDSKSQNNSVLPQDRHAMADSALSVSTPSENCTEYSSDLDIRSNKAAKQSYQPAKDYMSSNKKRKISSSIKQQKAPAHGLNYKGIVENSYFSERISNYANGQSTPSDSQGFFYNNLYFNGPDHSSQGQQQAPDHSSASATSWFDQQYENQLNSLTSHSDFNSNYQNNNFSDECSTAWLAVVAAAASKYQHGSNAAFDSAGFNYKKCDPKSFDYPAQFMNSTNYNYNSGHGGYGLYQNFDYDHHNGHPTATQQPQHQTSTGHSNFNGHLENAEQSASSTEKADISAFLLSNMHNLSGSASSTDSIGSSDLLNSSHNQFKMNNISELSPYSSLVKQVMDENELKSAIHVPVVRRSWTENNNANNTRDIKLEDQMLNLYSNPTAMFSI